MSFHVYEMSRIATSTETKGRLVVAYVCGGSREGLLMCRIFLFGVKNVQKLIGVMVAQL